MQKPARLGTPFIVIEGIDGAGTTTQVGKVVQALRSRNIDAVETREPSAGPFGTLARQILRGEISAPTALGFSWQELGLLFAADRLNHLASELAPRSRAGAWLVCDRYDHSSVAYQSASAGDPGVISWLRELNRHAPRPDLTLVIDVSPQVARARRLLRGGAKEIFDEDPFQLRLAAFYRDIDAHFPDDRIVHIDGDGDPDSVFAAILPFVIALQA